jgi:uncharacterized heparinase superfamily protein
MASLDARTSEGASAAAVADHRFRFLNVERRLPEIEWTANYVSPLWTYHLHYFDYAVDLSRAWRTTGEQRYGDRYVELWTSWLDASEAGGARIEPYPTSVRCLNALRSLWLIEERLPPLFVERLVAAVHVQLEWLAGHPERDLRANHLQKNLTALAWGSLAFAGPAALRWRRFLDELWDELREQVLPDGGHFERSPMYHAAAMDDFLRTVALCRAADVMVPPDVAPQLTAMTRAFQWLSRPDGTLHLFNDAANGERPEREELLDVARRVLADGLPEPAGAFALPDTGYFGFVDPATGRRLVIDAGPLGPSYQPGHAHCDMLSFELDLEGRPLIVDSGVHGYDRDPYREYVRSTRAHNTVAVSGRDQHEMWATFRVARRGEVPAAASRATATGGFEFEGACRHYHGRAVHRRAIELRPDALRVTDRIEGADGRPLTSWLHLHPSLTLEPAGTGFVAVTEDSPRLRVRIEVFGADSVRICRGERDPVQGWYCPEFGKALEATTVVLSVAANDGREFGYRLRGVTP